MLRIDGGTAAAAPNVVPPTQKELQEVGNHFRDNALLVTEPVANGALDSLQQIYDGLTLIGMVPGERQPMRHLGLQVGALDKLVGGIQLSDAVTLTLSLIGDDKSVPAKDKRILKKLSGEMTGVTRRSQLHVLEQIESEHGWKTPEEALNYADTLVRPMKSEGRKWVTDIALGRLKSGEAHANAAGMSYLNMNIADTYSWVRLHADNHISMYAIVPDDGSEAGLYYQQDGRADGATKRRQARSGDLINYMTHVTLTVSSFTDAREALRRAEKILNASKRPTAKQMSQLRVLVSIADIKIGAPGRINGGNFDNPVPGHKNPVEEGVAKLRKRYGKVFAEYRALGGKPLLPPRKIPPLPPLPQESGSPSFAHAVAS
jgi:hypothetical protein